MKPAIVIQLATLLLLVHAALGPQIKLPNGDVVSGVYSALDTESYMGIPYAIPPVNELRFKPPKPFNKSLDGFRAEAHGYSCTQMNIAADFQKSILGSILNYVTQSKFFNTFIPQSEDCLTLNVHRKRGLNSSELLPVMFWIYGGAFEFGGSNTYIPSNLLAQGERQGQNFIYVSINYRLGAFGFLGGLEIKSEGSSNAGFLDQRIAMKWVADNIASFGGDPTKITIFGESAGAMSVAHHMVAYNGNNTYKGKPLFRAAIMQSGSLLSAESVDASYPQLIFDAVADAAGCNNADDKLKCLRKVPYEKMISANNAVPGAATYSSLKMSYIPRPDGTTFSDLPFKMILDGKYTKIPYIIGDMNDEGTIFSLRNLNVSTEDEMMQYLKYLFPKLSSSKIDELLRLYPQNATQGSPYGTGTSNPLTLQYKRLSSIIGDLFFQAPRRIMLSLISDVPRYTYLSKELSGIPIFGTFHANDIFWQYYSTGSGTSIYRNSFISFACTLNPNNAGEYMTTEWPQYQSNSLANMIVINSNSLSIGSDDFRNVPMSFIGNEFEEFAF